MKREGLVEHDSLKEVVPPKLAHRLPKTFSEEELKKVFAVVTNQPREKAMLSLFLDSGITLQEIIALKTSDLNLTEGNAHVFREKTARERYVYFSPATALNIERYLLQRPEHCQDDHLFLTRDEQPLQPHRVQEILVRVGRKAGLTQRLSPHKLRHTFATLSLKYGSNLEYIRIQLGHSDIKTTSKFYLHASNSDVRQSHQKSSPVTNLGLRQPVVPTRDRSRSIHRARDEKPHP
jgi:integrase/recombinase XerD